MPGTFCPVPMKVVVDIPAAPRAVAVRVAWFPTASRATRLGTNCATAGRSGTRGTPHGLDDRLGPWESLELDGTSALRLKDRLARQLVRSQICDRFCRDQRVG